MSYRQKGRLQKGLIFLAGVVCLLQGASARKTVRGGTPSTRRSLNGNYIFERISGGATQEIDANDTLESRGYGHYGAYRGTRPLRGSSWDDEDCWSSRKKSSKKKKGEGEGENVYYRYNRYEARIPPAIFNRPPKPTGPPVSSPVRRPWRPTRVDRPHWLCGEDYGKYGRKKRTREPSVAPVESPIQEPTVLPTMQPTARPTLELVPTTPVPSSQTITDPPSRLAGTQEPSRTTSTASPSSADAPLSPTATPIAPSDSPSVSPSQAPSIVMSSSPTAVPSHSPSDIVSSSPSFIPSMSPSLSSVPSMSPSVSLMPSTPEPTRSPVVPTASPTERPPTAGTEVPVTPFSLAYEIEGGTQPDVPQFRVAQQATLVYLRNFLKTQFDMNAESDIERVFGQAVGSAIGPPRSGYEVSVVFTPDSEVVPSKAELDVFVEAAFQQPSVQDLVDALSELPIDNPFSRTQSVTYESISGTEDGTRGAPSETGGAPINFEGLLNSPARDENQVSTGSVLAILCIGLIVIAAGGLVAVRIRPESKSLLDQNIQPEMRPLEANIMPFHDGEQRSYSAYSSSSGTEYAEF